MYQLKRIFLQLPTMIDLKDLEVKKKEFETINIIKDMIL